MRTLFALMLVLAACSAPPAASDPLAGTRWQLVEVHYADGTVVTANGEALSFRDGTVWFQSGCNGCSVAYIVEGDLLRTGVQATCTEMACPPGDPTLSTLLLGAMRFVQENDQLRIEPADTTAQQPTLIFRRADG
ncbi:MAG: META domain-containing protein [Rhodothermaceae bacterium]|nr:META domain-containing protein [Rhodothermaceae bacterium]